MGSRTQWRSWILTERLLPEIGGKAGYMSADAGRWVDVLMAACGSSLLIASIFSMEEAKHQLRRIEKAVMGFRIGGMNSQPEEWGNEWMRKCNRTASLRLVALIFW